jgi:hypothetical protein
MNSAADRCLHASHELRRQFLCPVRRQRRRSLGSSRLGCVVECPACMIGRLRSCVHEDSIRRNVFYCHAVRVQDPW